MSGKKMKLFEALQTNNETDSGERNNENICVKPEQLRGGETCKINHNTCQKLYFHKHSLSPSHTYTVYKPPTDR